MIDNRVQYFDIWHEDWKKISIWHNIRSLHKFLAITTKIREMLELVTKLYDDNSPGIYFAMFNKIYIKYTRQEKIGPF